MNGSLDTLTAHMKKDGEAYETQPHQQKTQTCRSPSGQDAVADARVRSNTDSHAIWFR